MPGGLIELCSGNDSAQAASSFYEDPTLAELYYKRMTRYFNDCKKLLKTRSAGAYASCLPDVIDRRLHYFVFGY